MTTTRIIAIVIDTTVLNAYREDGSSISVLQGDARVQKLLDAMPDIEAQGFADVDLSYENPYKDFEAQIGGVIRFFKVAKSTLNTIVSLIEKVEAAATPPVIVPAGSVGKKPTPNISAEPLGESAGEEIKPQISQQQAVDQIMETAQSVNHSHFEADLSPQDTIVAVVGDQLVPGVEQVKSHLAHSTKIGSSIGMENFFKRIGAVIERRQHSVEDILRFMEKNDLPIADDGSLIVYKVLRTSPTDKSRFVDCHTKRVSQRIGSFVCVDETLVDQDRRNECSNGLHVARRGYIGGFNGDVCTLVKVAPEDVITVPHGDPDKVRVCGYHIIMALDNDSWDKLKSNVPMTSNPKAQAMLGRAVTGDHIGIIETVKITEAMGNKVEITSTEPSNKTISKAKVKPAVALDDETIKAADPSKVQPAQIAAVINEKTNAIVASQNTRQQKANELWNIVSTSTDALHRKAAATQLLTYKKTSKVSWEKLGLGVSQVEQIIEISTAEDEPEAEAPLELTKEMEVPAPVLSFAPGSRQLEARALFQEKKFTELKALKAKAKVSWGRLGFYESEINIINNS